MGKIAHKYVAVIAMIFVIAASSFAVSASAQTPTSQQIKATQDYNRGLDNLTLEYVQMFVQLSELVMFFDEVRSGQIAYAQNQNIIKYKFDQIERALTDIDSRRETFAELPLNYYAPIRELGERRYDFTVELAKTVYTQLDLFRQMEEALKQGDFDTYDALLSKSADPAIEALKAENRLIDFAKGVLPPQNPEHHLYEAVRQANQMLIDSLLLFKNLDGDSGDAAAFQTFLETIASQRAEYTRINDRIDRTITTFIRQFRIPGAPREFNEQVDLLETYYRQSVGIEREMNNAFGDLEATITKAVNGQFFFNPSAAEAELLAFDQKIQTIASKRLANTYERQNTMVRLMQIVNIYQSAFLETEGLLVNLETAETGLGKIANSFPPLIADGSKEQVPDWSALMWGLTLPAVYDPTR